MPPQAKVLNFTVPKPLTWNQQMAMPFHKADVGGTGIKNTPPRIPQLLRTASGPTTDTSAPSSFMGDVGGFFGDVGNFLSNPLGAMLPSMIGGIAKLFGPSPEELARKKLDKYTGELASTRDSETKRVSQEMSQGTASAMATAANIAGKQAGASGKSEQTASFALPATTNIAAQGGRQLRSAVSGIQSTYNRAIADAQGSMLGVPEKENWTDVAGNIGDLATQGLQQQSYFNRLQEMMDAQSKRYESMFG